jgi:hypothetical protein
MMETPKTTKCIIMKATSSGHQEGQMSFSSQGYHDTQETFHQIDNKLTNIEETTAAIQNTLLDHTQWQATMGHEVANLQQQQQQQNQNWEALFQHLHLQPPH